MKEEEEKKPDCELCNDTGIIEIIGDGDHFECDVIATKKCRCQLED